jgi:hypothetical protein
MGVVSYIYIYGKVPPVNNRQLSCVQGVDCGVQREQPVQV